MRNHLSSGATIAMAALSALLGACSHPPNNQIQLDDAARRIFNQLDHASDKAVFDEASKTFQQGPGGALEFAAAMGSNRRKLGRCQAPAALGKTRVIPTRYGLVSMRDYSRVCANGVAHIELSTVKRGGRAVLIGLHFTSPAFERPSPLESRPDWISKDDLTLLENLAIDPQADLETRAANHWRWRATHELKVGAFVCPSNSTVDISRNIKVVIAAKETTCKTLDRIEAPMLRLNDDGSATELGKVG